MTTGADYGIDPFWIRQALWVVLGLVLAWLAARLVLLLARYLYLRGRGPSYWEARLRGPQQATVTRAFAPCDDGEDALGTVRLMGELWTARCPRHLAGRLSIGQKVLVVPGERLEVTVLEIVEGGTRHPG